MLLILCQTNILTPVRQRNAVLRLRVQESFDGDLAFWQSKRLSYLGEHHDPVQLAFLHKARAKCARKAQASAATYPGCVVTEELRAKPESSGAHEGSCKASDARQQICEFWAIQFLEGNCVEKDWYGRQPALSEVQ